MPGNPKKLSQFWKELKRRNITRVLAAYIAAGFMILELVDMISEPFGLPEWSFKLTLFILITGLFITLIISWIYDLTSEGVEKTKPVSKIQEKEKPVVSNAWKITTYVSFAVIIGLVVMNVIGGGKQLRTGDIQSLVILPFENFTGDDQLDWFVSGMHAKLIGDVQRISDIEVLNRTSSNTYKNTNIPVQEIATELDADAVIEADVMCLGDSICFQVKVIQAFPKEKTLWIAEYKEAKSQILNLYNRITKQIATEVKVELTTDEDLVLAKSQTVDSVALGAYFKGLLSLDKINRESLQKALEYFNTATEIEPDWASPYSGLVEVWVYRHQMNFASTSVAIPKIYKHLNKLLELDPNSAIAHYTIAIIAFNTEWEWEKAEKEFLKSLELNPSNALCRIFYSHLLNILSRSDKALHQANLALKLDPHRSFILGLYAALMRQMGDAQSAIEYAKKALSIDPNHRFAKGQLKQAYFSVEDYDRWYELFKQRLWNTDDEYLASLDSIYQEQGYLGVFEERIKVFEEVKKSGGEIPILTMGRRYLALEEYDKAMDYYELAYENLDPSLAYLNTFTLYVEQLKQNPRYVALLKKMNLPLPED